MSFTGTLKPYQQEAVNRMVERGRILVAYDLGLGKTVITLAAVENLKAHDPSPTLVIVLASLKFQWAKEVQKFTDSTALVIDGPKKKRTEQWAQAQDFDYVITNYETVVNDFDLLASFDAVVLDEATAIKSFRSKRSRRVKEVCKRADIRFALTGTPIENGKPEEIYSIMQAIDPTILGRFDIFDRTFIVRNQWGAPERYRNLNVLHDRLSGSLIRKTQSDPDVAPYLPETIHRDPEIVSMDPKVRDLYVDIADGLAVQLREAIETFGSNFSLAAHYGLADQNGPPSELMGTLMSSITLLRQLCSHPRLVLDSADAFQRSYREALAGDGVMRGGGSQRAYELVSDQQVRDLLERARVPKLDALASAVDDHLSSDPDAKIVIFTGFVGTSREIEKRVGGLCYTGQMNARQKEEVKTQFQTDPDTRVLISTDAGGYGVDLPQANLLINYDLPWSAGKAVQRNGRIRRASSRWPSVVIQDLLCSNSIEIRQYDLLTQKNALSSAVVDGQGINDRGGVDFSAGSLLQHLEGEV